MKPSILAALAIVLGFAPRLILQTCPVQSRRPLYSRCETRGRASFGIFSSRSSPPRSVPSGFSLSFSPALDYRTARLTLIRFMLLGAGSRPTKPNVFLS
jgi:hypothetical protein